MKTSFVNGLIALCFLHCTLCYHASAQQFEWANTFSSALVNHITSFVVNANRSLIVTSDFSGTMDFNPGQGVTTLTSNGRNDIAVCAYETDGKLIWARHIGGDADEAVKEIKMDKSGNLFITGLFQKTVDFDPGPGNYSLTTEHSNSFILKLDNNGNFIWVKQVAHQVTEMDIDNDGNIILAGDFAGTKDFDPGPDTFIATTSPGMTDMFIVKLDNDGSFQWMKQVTNIDGLTPQQNVVRTDVENNIIFGGNFSGTMDFDPGPAIHHLVSAGSSDGFLLKLDKHGNFKWVRQFGADNGDDLLSVETDKYGNIFSTGAFHNTVDFDPGPAEYLFTTTSNRRSCFVLKLDSGGNFVYARNFSGASSGQALTIDSSGNLYIAGGLWTDVDFDPGPGTYMVSNKALFNVKLDANGDFLWATTFGAAGFESIYCTIKVDILNNVYYAGAFTGTIDFDAGPAEYIVTSAGLWDAFILKQSQCAGSLNFIDVATCLDYTFNGITYDQPGTYFQSFTKQNGCDSIYQITLTRGDKFRQVDITSCDEYTWNGVRLINSGSYRDTFSLANGCDSIVELNLVITRKTTTLTEKACGSYTWNGTIYHNSGTYEKTFRLSNGCDSTAILNLTIYETPNISLTGDTTICKGEILTLSAGHFDAYLWSDNSTGKTLTVTQPGNYWLTVTNSNNCSSTQTINIAPGNDCNNCDLTDAIKIYPNPILSSITIEKGWTSCRVTLNLYNAIGQLVLSEALNDGFNTFNIEKFAAGLYFFRLHSGNKILLKGKILKQQKS